MSFWTRSSFEPFFPRPCQTAATLGACTPNFPLRACRLCKHSNLHVASCVALPSPESSHQSLLQHIPPPVLSWTTHSCILRNQELDQELQRSCHPCHVTRYLKQAVVPVSFTELFRILAGPGHRQSSAAITNQIARLHNRRRIAFCHNLGHSNSGPQRNLDFNTKLLGN